MDVLPLLCLSATKLELQPCHEAIAWQRLEFAAGELYCHPHAPINLCHSGIGKVNTATALCQALAQLRPASVLHLGIAGSFDPQLALGSVLLASSETDMDVGIRYADQWQDSKALGFPLVPKLGNTIPIASQSNGWHQYLKNSLQLPEAAFATSDSVSGDVATCRQRQQAHDGIDGITFSLESMEGVAAAQVCHRLGYPFSELRAVSNYVGVRDKAQWDIPSAVQALNTQLLQLIKMLT